MRFEVSADLTYQASSDATLILNLQALPSAKQLILKETFVADPAVNVKEVLAPNGEKRFKVLEITDPGKYSFRYHAEIDSQVAVLPAQELDDVPIPEMPAAVLPYLNPSRYCQSDKLYKFAFNHFGKYDHAFEKVMAVRDWIHRNVEYNCGGYTSAQTSAFDTITQQVGVCRDFAHLGIALCRALTIPARYFSGYAYQLKPQDFHACFEVYLGGHWVFFDPTKLVPVNGLLKIATGTDATETAVASIFGNLNLQSMAVDVKLLVQDFKPLNGTSEVLGYSYS